MVISMKDYETSSDEELIIRIRDGENEIWDYLIAKYKNLVLKKAKSMYILGGDNEDLIQEGMIGLYKAIRDFDFGRDAQFITFADICVSRQLFSAVQKAQRKKHKPLNESISLNSNNNESDGTDLSLVDALSKVSEKSPEELLIDKAQIDEIQTLIDNELSDLEKHVVRLFMTGEKVSEIARILSRDVKSTDNALQRAKQKIKKGLQLR